MADLAAVVSLVNTDAPTPLRRALGHLAPSWRSLPEVDAVRGLRDGLAADLQQVFAVPAHLAEVAVSTVTSVGTLALQREALLRVVAACAVLRANGLNDVVATVLCGTAPEVAP